MGEEQNPTDLIFLEQETSILSPEFSTKLSGEKSSIMRRQTLIEADSNFLSEDSASKIFKVRDINWADPDINRAGITPIYDDGTYRWIGLGVTMFSTSITAIGGVYESYDKDLLDTAVREYNEEVGNNLRNIIDESIYNCYAIKTDTIQVLMPISSRPYRFSKTPELHTMIWVTTRQLEAIQKASESILPGTTNTKAFSFSLDLINLISPLIYAIDNGIPFKSEVSTEPFIRPNRINKLRESNIITSVSELEKDAEIPRKFIGYVGMVILSKHSNDVPESVMPVFDSLIPHKGRSSCERSKFEFAKINSGQKTLLTSVKDDVASFANCNPVEGTKLLLSRSTQIGKVTDSQDKIGLIRTDKIIYLLLVKDLPRIVDIINRLKIKVIVPTEGEKKWLLRHTTLNKNFTLSMEKYKPAGPLALLRAEFMDRRNEIKSKEIKAEEIKVDDDIIDIIEELRLIVQYESKFYEVISQSNKFFNVKRACFLDTFNKVNNALLLGPMPFLNVCMSIGLQPDVSARNIGNSRCGLNATRMLTFWIKLGIFVQDMYTTIISIPYVHQEK